MDKKIISGAYTVVRCKDCDQDITHRVQYYDWTNKARQERVARCERCMWRLSETY